MLSAKLKILIFYLSIYYLRGLRILKIGQNEKKTHTKKNPDYFQLTRCRIKSMKKITFKSLKNVVFHDPLPLNLWNIFWTTLFMHSSMSFFFLFRNKFLNIQYNLIIPYKILFCNHHSFISWSNSLKHLESIIFEVFHSHTLIWFI